MSAHKSDPQEWLYWPTVGRGRIAVCTVPHYHPCLRKHWREVAAAIVLSRCSWLMGKQASGDGVRAYVPGQSSRVTEIDNHRPRRACLLGRSLRCWKAGQGALLGPTASGVREIDSWGGPFPPAAGVHRGTFSALTDVRPDEELLCCNVLVCLKIGRAAMTGRTWLEGVA